MLRRYCLTVINFKDEELLVDCLVRPPSSVTGCHLCCGCRFVSHRVFIPWRNPFFHIWPAAMSQRQWSKISTPRHNSLSWKNNSLMLQSSYNVWDDSESGEAYCLDVFVVQVHHWRMRGFPALWVFLDLCVNSRELCIMLCSVGSKGGVGMCVGIWIFMITERIFLYVCVGSCV